jgi:hypothetical protein
MFFLYDTMCQHSTTDDARKICFAEAVEGFETYRCKAQKRRSEIPRMLSERRTQAYYNEGRNAQGNAVCVGGGGNAATMAGRCRPCRRKGG